MNAPSKLAAASLCLVLCLSLAGCEAPSPPPPRTDAARETREMQPPPTAEPRREDATPPPPVTAAPQVPPVAGGLTPEEQRDIDVFRRASAAVVNITAVENVRRNPFSFDVMQIPRGTGTGFVWDKDGHVVTNYHVVAEAEAVTVTLADRTEWEARLVGTAENKDIAVLRIKAPPARLVPLTVGRSADLQVGQRVLAVGNPFGLDQSLTVGVVSALGRELASPGGRTIRDVIQTDAAINPGNSGGPLLDSSGRLVGVNSAIYSPSGAFAGIGFAVPVDTVRRFVPQIISGGRPVEPGIGIEALHPAIAAQNGLKGVVVRGVMRGSPADEAGLEGFRRSRSGRVALGDTIVAVNGKPVGSLDDLAYAFEQIGVGRSATLTVERDGARRNVTVRLVDLQ